MSGTPGAARYELLGGPTSLGDAEAHVRRILDEAPVIVFSVDRGGVCILSEGPAQRILGRGPGEIVGRSVAELFPDVPDLCANLGRALAGETFSSEVSIRDTWWSIHYAPVHDAAGDVSGAMGVGVDITDRRRAVDEARKAAAFLDDVVESLPLMIFVKDAKELRFVRFNRAAEELLGVSRDELLGKTDLDLFPAEEANFFRAKDREVLHGHQHLDIPVEPIHTRHRGTRYLHTQKIPIYGPDGDPLYLLGISADITEHKQMEEEQQRLLTRLQELDQLKDRLISNLSHELRTPLTVVLNAVERLAEHLSPEAPERRELLVIERSAQALVAQVADLLQVPPAPAPDLTDLASAGGARPEGGLAQLVDDGRPLVVLAEDNVELNQFLTGVLARDFRVSSARDGEEALRLALATPPDLIVTDLMMPRMTGEELLASVRASPELSGVPVIVITAWDDRAVRIRLLRAGAQDYVTKPFSTDELRARAANLVALKRTRDVLQQELDSRRSDVVAMARELGQRRRELEEALATTHAARRQAEEADRLKTEFLALLAHEIRTPVHALKLRRAVLERQLVTGSGVLEHVRGVAASAERLYRLFDTLLDFARLERGPASVHRTPTNLVQLVSDLVEEARPHAEAKGLTIAFTAPPGIPPLDSDAALVRIAVANLVGNAVKFMPERPDGRKAIEVRVDHDASGHRVTVTDSGPGIPREAQERIFEPFVHLEPLGGKHAPGVGLGLPIARRLVEALGGHLTVSSTPGTGSAFTVVLPAQPVAQRDALERSSAVG